MASGVDLVTLRQLVGDAVAGLMGYTHRELAEACERLGLPEPPGQDEGTKRERINHSFAALSDADLPKVAERILATQVLSVGAAARNAIQDVLWAAQGTYEIPKRTRREIARDLDLADLVYDADRFSALLDRLWVLGDDPFEWLTGTATGLRAQIERHVYRNPGDWSTEELFEQLGAFDAGDTRFARFLDGMVSADVIPDEPAQRHIVNTVNPHLRSVGAELRETGADGGYPVFSVVPAGAARNRRPKNLIFASLAKPDIRFRDAIDNDVEIVKNADKVLVYDRPITGEGIRWRDLQAWWQDTHQLPGEEEAKRSLYQRLRSSLPGNSPPQRALYELYHEIHASAVQDLPALLPEVWLHWDPKTVRDRGRDALLRFRMDFLLLLPHGQRVVLEVDGSQHYTSADGRPNGTKYAANVRGDRDLKLSGYEVFRFGATELQDRQSARALLQQFFADLFRRFQVTPHAVD
jgi:very-short-patch-repair endonuclease